MKGLFNISKKLSEEFVREMFSKREYKMIGSYKNNYTKIDYICLKHKENGIQNTTYGVLRSGSGCKFCGREKASNKLKVKYEHVKNEFEKHGFVLLDDIYINSSTKMRCKCIKHPEYIQEKTYNNIHSGRGCKYCAGIAKLTFEFVKSKFTDKNYELLDNEYINGCCKLRYKCNKHPKYIQEIVYNDLNNGYGCYYCGREKVANAHRTQFDVVKNEFIKWNYILLSDNYNNCRDKLNYICNKHPNIIQQISYDSLKSGHGCFYCGREKQVNSHRTDIGLIKEMFAKRNYVLLSTKYSDPNIKLKYICLKHNRYIQNIKFNCFSSGQGCKYCAHEKVGSLQRGSKSRWWKGGYSNISIYLRDKISIWRYESINNCNYICVISGKLKNIDVHHLYPFFRIVKETMTELGFPVYQQINRYTDDELKLIESKCLEIHYRYPLGVCLNKDLHRKFHYIYGYDFNLENFNEFRDLHRNRVIM